MDILAAVETSYDRLGTLTSAISPGQLNAPTPLPGWDVRTLLDHTLGFIAAITDCANGAPMAEHTASGIVQSDPVTALQRTVFDSLAAWRQPGALDASTATPLGPMPAPRHSRWWSWKPPSTAPTSPAPPARTKPFTPRSPPKSSPPCAPCHSTPSGRPASSAPRSPCPPAPPRPSESSR